MQNQGRHYIERVEELRKESARAPAKASRSCAAKSGEIEKAARRS